MKVLEFHQPTKDSDGCMFVLGDGTEEQFCPVSKENPKGFKRVFFTRYCGKVWENLKSALCPHHALIIAEHDAENARRMERARNGKERKKLMREALEASPLRALNEPDSKETGYQV